MPVTARLPACIGLLLGILSVANDVRSEPLPSKPRATDAANECERDPPHRALAVGATLVPGVLVHGAGHWVLCERSTAKRLLLIEGVGVGSTLVSGAGLFATGASRYFVAPLALGVLAGVSLFGLSLFADVYGVLAPPGGLGKRPAEHALAMETGARWIYDPHFSHRAFLSHGFRLNTGVLWLAPRMDVGLDSKNRRYSLIAGRRFLESTNGSYLDVKLGLTDHAYDDEGFSLTIAETALAGRLELSRVGRTLRGAFADAEIGYARQWSRFEGFSTDSLDELLFRTGFGLYLGRGRPFEGETRFSYDHRRDTFTGGLRVAGIGAGYLGFVEQRTELYFGRIGAALEFGYGSAFIVSGSLLMRLGKK